MRARVHKCTHTYTKTCSLWLITKITPSFFFTTELVQDFYLTSVQMPGFHIQCIIFTRKTNSQFPQFKHNQVHYYDEPVSAGSQPRIKAST